jgi:hypothetical protein
MGGGTVLAFVVGSLLSFGVSGESDKMGGASALTVTQHRHEELHDLTAVLVLLVFVAVTYHCSMECQQEREVTSPYF